MAPGNNQSQLVGKKITFCLGGNMSSETEKNLLKSYSLSTKKRSTLCKSRRIQCYTDDDN